MSSFSRNDPDVADLLALGVQIEPAHKDFGIIISSIDGPLKDLILPTKQWLRPLVEKYLLVVVKNQHDLIDNEAAEYVPAIKDIFADPSKLAAEDIAIGNGGKSPEIQVLGSPNSSSHPTATFIPARPQATDESLREWIDEDKPCAVTDWHADEPWLSCPPKYTLALCAESTGPNATMFSSTVALYNRTDETVRERLEGTQTLFAPPPWLSSEAGKKAKHATVQQIPTLSTDNKSYYLCMDSTVGIDGMKNDDAKKIVWELTQDCMKPEHVYRHDWQKGDLLFWDDTRTLHARTPYAQNNVDRVLYRMRVMGTEVQDEEGCSRLCYVPQDERSSTKPLVPSSLFDLPQ